MRTEQEIIDRWASLMEQSDRLYEMDDKDSVKLSKKYQEQAKILRWVLDESKKEDKIG